MADGVGITLPRPGYGQDPYQVYLDKCVVATPLGAVYTSDDDSHEWDILINAGDADTDTNIPIFFLPSGALVLDVGVQVLSAMTDNAEIIVGDYLDSDGWLASDAYEGSDETLDIKWATNKAVNFLVDSTTDYGAIATGSTTSATFSTYGLNGGKIGIYDTSSTSSLEEYVIFMHNKEAVDIIGVVAFWIKYSLASLNSPVARSSDLGGSGD